MTVQRIGFILGLVGFILTLLVPAPGGMPLAAWHTAGLVWWMAAWWMSEALPLSATALLPFLVLPMLGVADASKTAAAYNAPTLFLVLGGAFLALTVERTGLHRRLALAVLKRAGNSAGQQLLAVMAATAFISMFVSNTASALIMMPLALAILVAGGVKPGETRGMAGALPLGIAFAASIGGLGTMVGTPTNALSAGLIAKSLGTEIGFAEWSLYGLPIVLLGIPLAALILGWVHRLGSDGFDPVSARGAIGEAGAWSVPEKRLLAIMALTLLAWLAQPWIEPLLPKGALTDGTIAVAAGLVLLILPDGSGRPMLTWHEANRAPWDLILMLGGGLALAMGMTEAGLPGWLGQKLLPLAAVPLPLVALILVAFVILVTEFANNLATASAVMPVVAALVLALDADPILLALPAALAASWGFMLPSGSAANAIAWSTGHVALPRILKAGLLLDIAGIFLIVGVVWAMAAITG